MASERQFVRQKVPTRSKSLFLPAWTQGSRSKGSESVVDERGMYAAEKQDNFRWLSKLAGSYAKCGPLGKGDLAPEDLKKKVDGIGQYSELVYSDVPVKSLFEGHRSLKEEGVLLEYQEILSDCDFLRSIRGETTDLSAFVVYRRSAKQLVVSISGSSSPKHILENLRAIRTPWPGASLEPSDPSTSKNVPTVHSGFLRLYQDIETILKGAIQDSLERDKPEELIITGHSMGGSVSHLLCMDLLSKPLAIPLPKKICLATYGTPRTGNVALVNHYLALVEAFRNQGSLFEEYSVKAYNDGVPAVPPRTLGYVHFSKQPLYAHRRMLYTVPLGNEEASLFNVANESQSQDSSQVNRFLKGGHNYYNGRDLEGFRRISNRLAAAGFPESPEWKGKFREG